MNLIKEVDTFLEDRDLERVQEKVRKSHHPSEFSGCNRAIVYQWLKAPVSNPRDAEGILRMDMGKAVELLYLQYFKDMGHEVSEQVEIEMWIPGLKYPIHGYQDYILKFIDGDVHAEMKTVWGRGLTDVKNNGPRDSDVAQAKIYMVAETLHAYKLLYVARDTMWRTEFNLKMDNDEMDTMTRKVKEKFSLIEDCVENNIIPKRGFRAVVADGEVKGLVQRKGVKYKSDWQCMYCVRRDYCYADERSDYQLHIPEGL